MGGESVVEKKESRRPVRSRQSDFDFPFDDRTFFRRMGERGGHFRQRAFRLPQSLDLSSWRRGHRPGRIEGFVRASRAVEMPRADRRADGFGSDRVFFDGRTGATGALLDGAFVGFAVSDGYGDRRLRRHEGVENV